MRINRLFIMFVLLCVLSSCGLGGDTFQKSVNEDFLTSKQAVPGLKAPVHKKVPIKNTSTSQELSQEKAQKQVAATKVAIKQAKLEEEAKKQAEAEQEAQKQAEEKRATKQRTEEKKQAQQTQTTKEPKQQTQNASNQESQETKTEPKKKFTHKTTAEESAFSKEIVRLTNGERKKHGLQALKTHQTLAEAAYEKSRDMAINDYFNHISPTYGSPLDMIRQWGINYSMAGENIASGHTDAQQLVSDWMESEPHREAILKPEFTHIGVGTYSDGNYFTQLFIQRHE